MPTTVTELVKLTQTSAVPEPCEESYDPEFKGKKRLSNKASSVHNSVLIKCPQPQLLPSANCSVFPCLSQSHEQRAMVLRHQARNHDPTRPNHCRHMTVAWQLGDFFYQPSSSKLYSGDSHYRLVSSRTTTLNSLSLRMILSFLSSARSHLVLHTWPPPSSSL